MGVALIGLLGVAIGTILGWIPQFVMRGDARKQEARADEREKREDEQRRESHVTGALVKCAQATNEFLAARQLYVDAAQLDLDDTTTRLDLLEQSHARAAQMKTAWTEAFVIVPENNPRRNIVRMMLSKAWSAPDQTSDLDQLDALAETSGTALKQLIGTEPAP